ADEPGASPDAAALSDLAAPAGADLAQLADLSGCRPQTFPGFFGASDTPRTLDCACGCIIDSFDGAVVSSFWGNPHSANASFAGQPGTGVVLSLVQGPGASVESGTLNSFNPVSPFYAAGDFDLVVEYRLPAPLPPDAHVILGAQPQLGNFTVERGRAV